MKREQWKTKLGFIWAAIGSAIGLGSIWRFPYIVGENGGALFIGVFMIALLVIGIPILLAELVIGRKTHLSPAGAFETLGGRRWEKAGALTILTGFIISSFYSVVAGWTFGYLIESIVQGFGHFFSLADSKAHFETLTKSPYWSLSCHGSFMGLSAFILYQGIQKGIESWNSILMPLLLLLLVVLAVHGLTLPHAGQAVAFLLMPDLCEIKAGAVIAALGQAFFGLSLGQGTMVTYGSYLTRKENLLKICLPIASSVIIISLLAGIAIYTTVFAYGLPVESGPHLMFQILPMIFHQMPLGRLIGIAFFISIAIAGLTSQISAMEPSIAYLVEKKGMRRHQAVITVAVGAFLLGIPSALAFGVLGDVTLFKSNFFELISTVAINGLVPLGGLLTVGLLAKKVKEHGFLNHLAIGADGFFDRHPLIAKGLFFLISTLIPLILLMIFITLL